MARTAVPGRLGTRLRWRVGRLAERRSETDSAVTLAFDVPDWTGHLPGQHVDVRLTAEDGYSTQRSYSVASAPGGDRVELTVQRVADGEVSPYLADDLELGDAVELRGPVGGWFVWDPADADPTPVLLVAGGSGIVPLMAMIRTRRQYGSRTPFRLVYSVRTPEDRYYLAELERDAHDDPGLDIDFVYTRRAPEGWSRLPGRLTAADLETGAGLETATDLKTADRSDRARQTCFVCGPTGFVETAADLLVGLGHDPARIKTERFGPTGV